MSLKQLEESVAKLSESELREFSAWFESHVAEVWDQQIERDVETGKFDKLFAEIEGEVARGEITPL